MYFQNGCPDIRSVFGVVAETFKKNRNLQKRFTSRRQKRRTSIVAPHMTDLVFLN